MSQKKIRIPYPGQKTSVLFPSGFVSVVWNHSGVHTCTCVVLGVLLPFPLTACSSIPLSAPIRKWTDQSQGDLAWGFTVLSVLGGIQNQLWWLGFRLQCGSKACISHFFLCGRQPTLTPVQYFRVFSACP